MIIQRVPLPTSITSAGVPTGRTKLRQRQQERLALVDGRGGVASSRVRECRREPLEADRYTVAPSHRTHHIGDMPNGSWESRAIAKDKRSSVEEASR